MTKKEFLVKLKTALAGLPKGDIEERLTFYGEMIEDRMEEGVSEEEAVGGVGKINDIVSQIAAEVPFSKLVKERIKPKRTLTAGEITLIVLGSPLWFPLLIALFAVVLSLFVTVWAIIVSLWAVEVSFFAGVLGGILCSAIYLIKGNTLGAVFLFGAALILLGLAIVAFYGCIAATKGILFLTKKALLKTKIRFIKKESAK